MPIVPACSGSQDDFSQLSCFNKTILARIPAPQSWTPVRTGRGAGPAQEPRMSPSGSRKETASSDGHYSGDTSIRGSP